MSTSHLAKVSNMKPAEMIHFVTKHDTPWHVPFLPGRVQVYDLPSPSRSELPVPLMLA